MKYILKIYQVVWKILVCIPLAHFWGFIVLGNMNWFSGLLEKLGWTNEVWAWHLIGLLSVAIWTFVYELRLQKKREIEQRRNQIV